MNFAFALNLLTGFASLIEQNSCTITGMFLYDFHSFTWEEKQFLQDSRHIRLQILMAHFRWR